MIQPSDTEIWFDCCGQCAHAQEPRPLLAVPSLSRIKLVHCDLGQPNEQTTYLSDCHYVPSKFLRRNLLEQLPKQPKYDA